MSLRPRKKTTKKVDGPVQAADRKKKAQEKKDKYSWFHDDCIRFLQKFEVHHIKDFADPRIYLVDQFIKMTLDGISKHPEVLEHFHGSALEALEYVTDSAYRDSQPTDPTPQAFLFILHERVMEDIAYKKIFQTRSKLKTKQFVEASKKLKERGLLI